MTSYVKSPIFYMGNKYELLPNLLTYFPKKETVSEFIDFEEKQYSALGKGNAKSREVLIVNYEPPFEKYNIFDLLGE